MFQPTHPHGVRQMPSDRATRRILFQPTHPHGVRPNYMGVIGRIAFVSTHAPARGATRYSLITREATTFQPTHPHGVRPQASNAALRFDVFQPTHPHGVRPLLRGMTGMVFKFQPTHPHGVRHALAVTSGVTSGCFNPRTRTGCDGDMRLVAPTSYVSTHAPARGAT